MTSSAPKTAKTGETAAAPTPDHARAGALGIPGWVCDQLHDPVYTADLQGTIIASNPSGESLGLMAGAATGKNLAAIFGSEHQTLLATQVIPEVIEKGSLEVDLPCRAKSGGPVVVHVCLVLLRSETGSPAGILAVAIDRAEQDTASRPAADRLDTSGPSPVVKRQVDGTPFLIASPIMHKFMAMVNRVAGHNETVLVTGETGAGKELVARTIHESSHRSRHALIDINCAALPEHLVESELFGYEKGAFSGADSSKPGLFELADKSTLFLDEIGELQPQIQVKLLRVLDGQPYYRLGGNRKITVDVRVVAATNQDLEQAVEDGRFRKDLFHRLSQFQLRVPPLRERPEDIAALARHFLARKAPGKSFAPDAIACLQACSWPGNIRELRNLVAKLAMASDDRQIAAAQVTAELRGGPQVERRTGAVPLGSLNNMEEQMIIRALEQTGGHKAQAAERLGISRRTLSRKLREFEISFPSSQGSTGLGTISEEQQKFFRAKVDVAVSLRNANGKEVQAHAVNLSTGGMGLDAVSDTIGFAGVLDVSFLLPDSETEIRAKGRLVWTEAGGRAGLRFIVIEPELFEHLQHWTNRKMKDEGWETLS